MVCTVGLTVRVAFLKKGLKIPKGLPEAVNPVVTVVNTLHRKLKIEQH